MDFRRHPWMSVVFAGGRRRAGDGWKTEKRAKWQMIGRSGILLDPVRIRGMPSATMNLRGRPRFIASDPPAYTDPAHTQAKTRLNIPSSRIFSDISQIYTELKADLMGLNRRPTVCKTGALTAKLRTQENTTAPGSRPPIDLAGENGWAPEVANARKS